MVNYGRPSKDCLPCRKRKLRCNLDPLGCSQCRRAKLACHGYRNLNELAFRDETWSVANKVLARQSSVTLLSNPHSDCDALSRDAFLSLYIDRYSHGFDALAPLLATSPTSGYLRASVDAVSLAFMAYQEGRPELAVQANRRYLVAIRSLRTEILRLHNTDCNMSPISNAFLQSVLLLDLYEKLDRHHHRNTAPRSSSSWLSHASGALAMVKARPQTQFSDPSTRHLASRIVIALTISCGAAGIRVPEALTELHSDLASHVQSPKLTYMGLLSASINLHADIREAMLSPEAIVLRAEELDMQLALVESSIPGSWRPQVVKSDSPLVLGGYYDRYPDHYSTQVFNAFRIQRLVMSAIIRETSVPNYTPQEVARLARDICASVPQFLLQTTNPGNTVPPSPLQRLQCHGVLTPLYVAAQTTTDARVREWILQILAYMIDSGIQMARYVRNTLIHSPETDYWAVFSTVGSCGITA
ncbi:hypothetical protein C7974DRAFT_426875 [Boeremia exigua]|uniref:uncharacterized protein n=1 Tax=Boeremia exigua TaxID=749465 RepID=UPI001E8DE217|nr:uncharacterized protein C7974DRAFT_426875 [Boeremia exigua]KAH6618603.1 hypothetical protein C7974DRAFT_426875 [Boeremia exigua]